MSLSAVMIDALVASGATAEMLAAVFKADIAEREAQLESRRAKDAERQRRHRESRNVTQCHSDNADSVTDPALSPSPLSSPQTPQQTPRPHTHPDNTTPRAREADPFPCPEWCDPSVWADLKRNRKTKRLTNTVTAHRQFVAAVEAMADDEWPPGRLVEAIAAKGWGGAYDPREDMTPNDRPIRQRLSGNSTLRELAERSIAGG